MTSPTNLPPLRQHESPNQSSRRGQIPFLIVAHRPVGSFEGAEATLVAPRGDDSVSAHVLTGTRSRAVQLVPWDRKAWACATFNTSSYNVETADEIWLKTWTQANVDAGLAGAVAWAEAARLFAFLCKRTGIPPRWSQDPLHDPGITRHLDLGRAGGGHGDPTANLTIWRAFVARVKLEHNRGGFRETYGLGTLHRIDT